MKYIGKDIIHYGCGLELNPERALSRISRSARKNIHRADKAGFIIERKKGTPEELEELRKIWYLPDDPNFPDKLSANDFLYMAYLEGKLTGGIILIPVGSHLFLNNLTANEKGKAFQLQGYLLWHVINDLKDSGFRYIDIGVSYRPNLYRFFKKWSTFHYPVIFNPPSLKPLIRFAPFKEILNVKDIKTAEEKISDFCLNRPYMIVPELRYAEWILNDLGIAFDVMPAPEQKNNRVQIVDLTFLLPVQYGAIIIGHQISEKELWDNYGCYDYFKTEYLKKVLSMDDFNITKIRESRKRVYEYYLHYFKEEDVIIKQKSDFYDSFVIEAENSKKIAGHYNNFGVEILHRDSEIHFPCHQNLKENDVEYVFSIYRGYLNLCSDWIPTHVRGSLK